MSPALILMSDNMTNLNAFISTMTNEVSGIGTNVDNIRRLFEVMTQTVNGMGRDVNRMGWPMKWMPFP
ncbi:MAG: hypothetical protein WCP34_10990 [Pseudomonadota bacterium]